MMIGLYQGNSWVTFPKTDSTFLGRECETENIISKRQDQLERCELSVSQAVARRKILDK